MFEVSGRCHDESCLKESNPISKRLYLCSHHCDKMLCAKHLSEHDQYIDKQTQYQNELKRVWNDYIKIFNEDKIQQEFKNLKIKLENHQKLSEDIENLLTMNHYHDSINENEKLQTAIETVQKAIAENQSESMPYAASYDNESNNVNVSTTENVAHPEVTNNNEDDKPPVRVKDRIRNREYHYYLKKSQIEVSSSSSSDESSRTISSESNCDGDDEVDSPDDNKHMEAMFPNSENIGPYNSHNNRWEQISNGIEQLATMNTTASFDELPETQNVSAPNQLIFEKSESIDSSKDVHGSKPSTPCKSVNETSEDSCY